MAKQIKNVDIYQKDIFANFIKSAKEASVSTKELNKQLILLHKDFTDLGKGAKKELAKIKIDKPTIESFEKLARVEIAVTKGKKELIKVNKDHKKVGDQLKKLTDEQVKAKIKFNQANSEQKKILRDVIILENKQAGVEERLLATNRKLARQRKTLSKLDKNYERDLKRINNRINSNNKLLVKNSDELKKGRLQVGSYSKGIKEAAQSSGLFGGILGKLAAIQGTIAALTKKQIVSDKITTANTYKQIVATKSLTASKKAQIVTQKLLNQVLKASPLFIMGAVVAGLVATFTRTQKRVDQLSDAMASMGAIIDIVVDRFSQIGEGVILMFNNTIKTFDRFKLRLVIGATKLKLEIQEALRFEIPKTKLTDAFEFGTTSKKIKGTKDELALLETQLLALAETESGIDMITSAFDGLGDEIEREVALAGEFNALRRELNREQKIFSIHLNEEISANKKLQLIVRNKVIDDNVRLETLKEITESEKQLSESKIEFAKRELTLSLDALKIDAERATFIQELKDGLITSDEAIKKAEEFTLSSSAGEAALFNIIDKINDLKKEEIEFDQISIKLTKQKSGLLKEIGAKVSKGVIVEAQNQLKLSLDINRSDEERIKSLAKFNDLSIKAYKTQLDANIITQQEFDSRRLEAEIKVQQGLKKIRDSNNDSEFNLEVFRRELAIEREEDIDEKAKKEIELNVLKYARLLELARNNADDITLLEEKQEAERLRILKQAEADKKSLKDKASKEDEKRRKEELEEVLEFAEQITSGLGDQLNERLDNQANALDEELSDAESALKVQQDRAAKGLENTVAAEEENINQIQLRQLEQEKKAAQVKEAIRLGELFLTLKEAEAQEEVNGSTARALAGVAESKAIVQGIKASLDLAGFEKGGLVEGGEQIIRINEKGKEFVIDAPTTSALGLDKQGSSMNHFKQMMLDPNMEKLSDRVVQSKDGNYKVVKALESLESVIANKPETIVNIDEIGNIITTMKKGGYSTKTTLKTGSRL